MATLPAECHSEYAIQTYYDTANLCGMWYTPGSQPHAACMRAGMAAKGFPETIEVDGQQIAFWLCVRQAAEGLPPDYGGSGQWPPYTIPPGGGFGIDLSSFKSIGIALAVAAGLIVVLKLVRK